MALIIEYENTLLTGEQPYISHEKDSTLFNYYIQKELALDKHASINGGQYDNINFEDAQRHLTTKAVSRIGIKNFPGIGGIGFYKDAYSDEILIVAPIHIDRVYQQAPILNKVEVVDNMLHIVITPPSNLKYTCYRVIVRQGAFAFEYITYKTDYSVDLPTVKGTYAVYCIGYDETTGAVSEDSNVLTLELTTGSPDWSPASIDMTSVEARLSALEEEVENYPDEEITESVAEVIASV